MPSPSEWRAPVDGLRTGQVQGAALRDRAIRTLLRVGWRVAGRVPEGVVRRLTTRLGDLAARRRGSHVEQLRDNLTRTLNTPVSDDLLRRAVGSQLRNFAEGLALPSWSAEEVRRRVSTVDEGILRTAYAGTGAVVALPHSGNWDLAGAWACQTGMPVTTVAEQLAGPDFTAYAQFRSRLGLEVLAHTDPHAMSDLMAAVRRGRLVCVMADRDLTRTGLPVLWAGHPTTMPAGPAVVARRTGAALIPAVCLFTPTGMQIRFGAPVPPRPGRPGLVAMTQQVADFFVETIRTQPEDWHMLQPFFTDAPQPTAVAG